MPHLQQQGIMRASLGGPNADAQRKLDLAQREDKLKGLLENRYVWAIYDRMVCVYRV